MDVDVSKAELLLECQRGFVTGIRDPRYVVNEVYWNDRRHRCFESVPSICYQRWLGRRAEIFSLKTQLCLLMVEKKEAQRGFLKMDWRSDSDPEINAFVKGKAPVIVAVIGYSDSGVW